MTDIPLILGAARGRSADLIPSLAKRHKIEPAVVDAIITVEGGLAFDPDQRLALLPERFKLYQDLARRADAKSAKVAVSLGLAATSPNYKALGDYNKNASATGELRWDWWKSVADMFGPEYACRNASWGIGQIMGFNHNLLGYPNARTMVVAFADDEDEQIRAMFGYFEETNMMPALKTRNWRAIARAYNGAGYERNGYHEKLAAAYAASSFKRAPEQAADTAEASSTSFGDHGPDIAELQRKLVDLGFPTTTDGDFGHETEDAVRAFQRRNHIVVDGIVGPETRDAIFRAYPKEPRNVSTATVIKTSTRAQGGAGAVVTGVMGMTAEMANIATQAPPAPPTVQDYVAAARQGVEVGQVATDTVSFTSTALTIFREHALILLSLMAILLGWYIIRRQTWATKWRLPW